MDGLRAVNVYTVETDDALTVIDGGWAIAEARRQLEASLDQVGLKLADITRFLVTHHHRDHYTQAIAVRREYGSSVALGIGEKHTLDLMNQPGACVETARCALLRQAGAYEIADAWARVFGTHKHDVADWEYPDVWLSGDQSIDIGGRTLLAASTPGHTRGHYVFADHQAGVLFAGDHVLSTITPSIGFEPLPAQQPLGDFLKSLVRVRSLPDLTLLPAHGPVTDSSHARVDELLAFHDDRLRQCLDAVAAAGSSAYDVARELPWTRHERRFHDLDLFNSALATMETKAHLDLLVARGSLVSRDDGATHIYMSLSDAHHVALE
jgi:glyoxylase-like metal-dependent hydrolase (beta-lactamase superfamily II)